MQILNLFDDLMILNSGKIIYHGSASEVVDHYAEAGFPCPVHTNLPTTSGQLRTGPLSGIHLFSHPECAVNVISPAKFTDEEIREAEENADKVRLLYKRPQVQGPPTKRKRDKKDAKAFHARYVGLPPLYCSCTAILTRVAVLPCPKGLLGLCRCGTFS
jgi:ABC-type multidrug transport system ATPase subunit